MLLSTSNWSPKWVGAGTASCQFWRSTLNFEGARQIPNLDRPIIKRFKACRTTQVSSFNKTTSSAHNKPKQFSPRSSAVYYNRADKAFHRTKLNTNWDKEQLFHTPLVMRKDETKIVIGPYPTWGMIGKLFERQHISQAFCCLINNSVA